MCHFLPDELPKQQPDARAHPDRNHASTLERLIAVGWTFTQTKVYSANSSGQRTRYRLSRGGNRQANNALYRIVVLRMRHREPRTMAYFTGRRAEGLTDRDIIRCLKRHVANEIYAALLNPSTDAPVGHQLRIDRQHAGIPITVLAATLGVPYQRLRRLEIGTRADPELEHRATLALVQITPRLTA
ncbi:transposase [Subtercola frigoramans]|uniref:DNA-binding transcriptional regulator YiaG n=1 Tax=Subtercola frigoramans TaxID=120298 RepID=A0ABS2L8K3_9MICO|nr:transposase [Subtercola frigoramans]MBM7473430.1 DNA-binding transcriptional regulator YiaG [Subtercola frigoramans]